MSADPDIERIVSEFADLLRRRLYQQRDMYSAALAAQADTITADLKRIQDNLLIAGQPCLDAGQQSGDTLRAMGDTGFAPFGRGSPVLSQDPNARARRAENGNRPSGAGRPRFKKTPTPAPFGCNRPQRPWIRARPNKGFRASPFGCRPSHGT